MYKGIVFYFFEYYFLYFGYYIYIEWIVYKYVIQRRNVMELALVKNYIVEILHYINANISTILSAFLFIIAGFLIVILITKLYFCYLDKVEDRLKNDSDYRKRYIKLLEMNQIKHMMKYGEENIFLTKEILDLKAYDEKYSNINLY